MHFPILLATQGGLGTGISDLGIIAVIAALVCLLCAEIVCIGVLIKKMIRASKAKKEGDSSNSNLYGAALIGLTAIPQTAFLTITCLAWLTAAGALIFVVLLVVCRAKGYDFAVASKEKVTEEDKPESTVAPEALASDEDAISVAASVSEETPFAVFDMNDLEELPYEEPEEIMDLDEPALEAEEETVSAEGAPEAEEAPIEEVEETAEEPVEQEVLPAVVPAEDTAVAPKEEHAVSADGAQPYKVVEKIVTETYKEVIKETAAPTEQSTAADAVLNKLSDLLDYELQKRKEQDQQAELAAQKTQDAPLPEAEDSDEEEELDEEEDEIVDENDPKDEDDVDGDESEHFTGNERIIGFDEATGCYIVASYRKSFEAKLIQSRPHIKKYYSEIKNALLSYSGMKGRISWGGESFQNERQPIAKINVKTRVLELYLALEPETLEDSVYHGDDVSGKKKYADTPFRYKIRTPRKFQWAMELVQRVCEEHGLSPIDTTSVDYASEYAFDTTENLVERGLIREYIRQEKPATTFELDPDHVPEMPEEDGSVIPANANFSWEFDNEAMENKPVPEEEEVVTSEPAAEEASEQVEEAPAVETPVEPAPAQTVKETVKVTEMRYTERYYANAEPVYEQTVTTTDSSPVISVEAIAEPATEPVEAETAQETVILVEPKSAAEEAPVAEEESYFFSDDEKTDAFSADKFEDADPFAAFRGEIEPLVEESEAVEDETVEDVYEDVADEEPIAEALDETFFDEETVEEEAAEEAVEEATVPEENEPLDEDVTEELEETMEDEAQEAFAFVDLEEETDEAEYSEEEYAEEEYAEEEYAEEEYAEEEYTEEEYAEEEYDEEAYAEEEYSEEEYDDEDYAYSEEEEYAEEYDEDGEYAEYGEEDYEEDAYAEDYAYESKSQKAAPQSARAAHGNNPSVAIVDICAVEAYFPEGSVVNLQTLKEKGLIVSGATTLKIYSSGYLTKPLTIEAKQFTVDAIHAIHAAGGHMEVTR